MNLSRFARSLFSVPILILMLAVAGITSYSIWGADLDWQSWGIRTKVFRTVIGERIAEVAGETLMTSQQIREHMADLDNEITRLQWLEAESWVTTEKMDHNVLRMTDRHNQIREDLFALSLQPDANTSVILHNGQEISPGLVDATSRRLGAELNLVEERIHLYGQSRQLYVDTSLQARGLWQEAEQNMVTMDAYLALYEATIVDEATIAYDTTAGNPNSINPNSGSPRSLLVALQEQVTRNQRIGELREMLELGFSGEDVVGGND